VIDLSFAISRTLVYTVLTSILVGTFALIDFASAKLLEHLQIALLLEALAALAFGIWLKALHNRIEGFVDRTLFRTRHTAEARLLRTAKTLAYADSEIFVDEALIIEACDALDLASAALSAIVTDRSPAYSPKDGAAATYPHFRTTTISSSTFAPS
jgi:hypothetical protein